MAAQYPLYIDSNGDFCVILSTDVIAPLALGSGSPSSTTVLAGNSTWIPNSVTLGSTPLALGGTVSTVAGLTSVTATTFVGALTGNASTATGIAGGATGSLPYQTGSGATGFVAAGSASQVLIGGASSPAWSNTPALSGANFTSIPNGALTNSSVTIGSTNIALGATATTLAGLTSVTSTTFVGALTGAASSNLLLSGGTMTGALILNADPVTGLGAATKQYVDNTVQGLSPKPTAYLATTAALPANTYSNGSSGVGATLTATSNGVLTVDGVATALNQLILVKNEGTAANNGLYVVTTAGAAGAAYVLTRHVDMDQSTEFEGAFIPVESAGTANSNTLWLANPGLTVTVGTTAITFTQLNAATSYTQGNGITISGGVISAQLAARLAFNGTAIDMATLSIGGSGVGTFTKFTVDTYGRVTATATAAPSDIGAQPSSASLTALAALASTGLLVQTGTSTFTDVTLAGTAGQITVTNGNGVSGAPTFGLASGVIGTPGTYNSVTVDTYGRVTAGSTSSSAVSGTQSSLSNNQGSTINIGQAVYANGSGTVKLAQANAAATRLCIGLVMDTSIANSANGNIQTSGIVTATTTQWNAVTGGGSGLTTGSKYYLSGSTAGGLTSTLPTTNYLVLVGTAISTTQLELIDSTPVRLS